MTTTRHPISGAWMVSDIIAGYLTSRVYVGYTKREAVRLFREEFPRH
jgi:hypothetical protein